MAVTNEQITSWLASNPGLDDTAIAAAMDEFKVTPAQMAQATGLDASAVQSRYDAAVAPLSMQSIGNTPGTGATGIGTGDTQAAASIPTSMPADYDQAYVNQLVREAAQQAGGTLSYTDVSNAARNLGISPEMVTGALSTGLITGAPNSGTGALAQVGDVDPYVYAYEYGAANDDFSGLRGLLQQTPDSTSLISKYNLTPEQIDQIEFGTGFDLDQSGGYGAGKVGHEWDYGNYLGELREGNTENALSLYRSVDPLGAQRLENMYQELLQQQTVTGGNWATGNLGSKDAAAMDFALRLMENNLGSIYDLGQRTVDVERYDGEAGNYITQETEFFNKKTGEALPDWARVASGNKLNYQINFAEDGTPIPYTTPKRSDWMEFREGFIKPAISIVALANPALAPYIAAGNALNAASKGDWGSAIVSGLTAASGFSGDLGLTASTAATLNDAKTAAQVLNAIDKGNPVALATALMQTDTGKELMGQDMGGGIKMGDVVNTAKIAQLVNTGNYTEALATAGEMVNSPNLKLSASAVNLAQAFQTGDPFKIISAVGQLDRAVKSADAAAKKEVTGDLGSRIYDDTITQAGADAFVKAKEVGASDGEAKAAADAVIGAGENGVVVNKVPDAGASNVVTTTYGDGGVDTNFGDLDGAVATQARNTEVDRLATAYETTTGKTLDKLTDTEMASLSLAVNSLTTDQLKNASIQDILSDAPKIVSKDDQGRWVDDKGYAYDDKGFKYAPGSDMPIVEVRGVGSTGAPTTAQNLDAAGESLVNWASTLEGTSGDVVRQTLSTLIGAGGEQVADLGTALANMGMADRYNLLVQLGQSLERTGQDLEIPGVTQATENFWNDIQGADTYAGKAAAAIKSVINNPLVLTQVAKEGFQEVLPIVTGGAVFKLVGKGAGIATDVLMNAAESMGSTSRQKFNEEIAKGTPVDQAEKLANADGWKAFAITAGTAGLADAALIKSYEKVMDKVIGKTATSVGKEWGEEGFEELAIALATGDDLPTALSKSIAGSMIGSKTSGSLTAGSNLTTDIQQAFAAEGLTSTDGSFRPETIVKADGTGAAVDTTTGAATGATTDVTAADDFDSIFATTGNTTEAVNTSVSTALGNGADVDSTISSVVDAANSTGANVNLVAANAANAAVAAGADAATASNAATTAVSNLTAGTTTGTGVTTGTGTGTGVTTGTGTGTGANVNTSTGTGTDTSTNTATGVTTDTVVDTNTNTTTTTTTNTNTNTATTVTTNNNTGTTTTTNVNNNTGVTTDTTTNGSVTTNVVTDTNTDNVVTVNTDTTTGDVIDVDGPGTVIDSDTVDLGDGVVIDITTGETLTSEEVEERKKKSKVSLPKTAKKPSGLLVGASGATPPYKPSDIEETWLGGQFRNIAPLVAFAGLLPENNPMFQDQQALSALRQASGLGREPEKPQSDYFSYGSEPSVSSVLAPYKRGGGVQDPTDDGKIMTSPLQAASGGDVEHKGSHYVQGAGGGQDDLIPAKLADGEYVFDAEIVAALGDGSNKEGARKLDEFREAIRRHKRSGSTKTIPPKAKSPLAYMKGIK